MEFSPISLHVVFAVCIAGFSVFLITAALLVIFFSFAVASDTDETSWNPIPLLKNGGLAIVIGFAVGVLLIHLIGNVIPIKTHYFVAFLASLLLITAGSLYVDYRAHGATVRLVMELTATVVVLVGGIAVDVVQLPSIGKIELGWWGFLLSLLWVVGLTNAYRLMSSVDGMAAGTAVIAGVFFSVITFQQGSLFIYLASLVLSAASFGFLIFNWPPAKIVLGDVGSAFLGFTFAVMAIIAARYDHSHTSMLVVPLLLFHMIFDVVLTYVRCLWRGKNVSGAGRKHLYELLVQLGYSERGVMTFYSGMAALQGIGAIWMVQIGGGNRVYVFLPFLLLQGVYSTWLLDRARKRGLV